MDRIYMNRIDGQRRIHVEIHDNEITDLLDDLKDTPEYYDATRQLLQILRAAEEVFSPVVAGDRRDAARQAAGQPAAAVRTLTPLEHDRAWHAIEHAASQDDADPGTILNAVLHALRINALRINAPSLEDEQAASHRRKADTDASEIVAYRDSCRPNVLLCREHGYGWTGITPLTAEDLSDGGICTWGRPGPDECGRDVLAAAGLAAPTNHDTEQQARNAVYSELMWPEWNPRAERHGMTADDANQHLDAYRAAILNSAADHVAGPHPDDCGCGGCAECATHRAARDLRRLAAGAES